MAASSAEHAWAARMAGLKRFQHSSRMFQDIKLNLALSNDSHRAFAVLPRVSEALCCFHVVRPFGKVTRKPPGNEGTLIVLLMILNVS